MSEPTKIQSTSNPTIKRLVRLRNNRFRRQSGRVVVDGWRETAQAVKAGLQWCNLFLLSDQPPTDVLDSADLAACQSVLQSAKQHHSVQLVSESVMQKIAYGQSGRGVVAEFTEPEHRLSDLHLPANAVVLVLDQIEKPGNIGAVFRCADAADIDAVILCDAVSDIFNPNAIRGSLGSVFSVPSASGSQAEVSEFLLDHKLRPLAARVQSSHCYWQADWTSPVAIILGSESGGLGDRWQQLGGQAIEAVHIPMNGSIDSLNLSVSAALLAYEALRHRAM